MDEDPQGQEIAMKIPTPKSWLAKTACLVSALLILAALIGFADCVINSACTKDLCVGLCLHCTWSAINGSVVIGLGTLLAAVFGLNVWRHQFQGQNDYRVAMELMKGVYAMRQAVRYARRPFVSVLESAARPHREGESPFLASARNEAHAYYPRTIEVSNAEAKLRVAHLEAIAHWGEDVTSPRLEPIWLIQRDLTNAYETYFMYRVRKAE